MFIVVLLAAHEGDASNKKEMCGEENVQTFFLNYNSISSTKNYNKYSNFDFSNNKREYFFLQLQFTKTFQTKREKERENAALNRTFFFEREENLIKNDFYT